MSIDCVRYGIESSASQVGRIFGQEFEELFLKLCRPISGQRLIVEVAALNTIAARLQNLEAPIAGKPPAFKSFPHAERLIHSVEDKIALDVHGLPCLDQLLSIRGDSLHFLRWCSATRLL